MTPAGGIPRELTRLQRPALLAAVVGAALLLGGFLVPALRDDFFRAYLFAWLFVLGLSLGCLGLVMLNHLIAGEWGLLLRRMGEAAAMNLPLVALLGVPLLFGLKTLFPWADPALVAEGRVLRHRAGYLNTTFFVARAVGYFVIWILLAWGLRRYSLMHDRTGDARPLRRAQRVAAGGVVLYIITMSLASVDWILSRDTHWFSTIIGLITIVGQAAAGMAFLTYVATAVVDREPLAPMVERYHLNDWGNLLLTLVILWAYMSFAQMLIIWMGNMQEDVSWYVQRGISPRAPNGWRWYGLLLVALHFFVPFFILLSRENKRRSRVLHLIAAWILIMRVADVLWWIAPTSAHGSLEPGHVSLLDVPALMALGGIWVTAWVVNLKGKPLLARIATETIEQHGDVDELGHHHAPGEGKVAHA